MAPEQRFKNFHDEICEYVAGVMSADPSPENASALADQIFNLNCNMIVLMIGLTALRENKLGRPFKTTDLPKIVCDILEGFESVGPKIIESVLREENESIIN